MNKTINQTHLKVRIIKLKNTIKLKENKVMCDKDIEKPDKRLINESLSSEIESTLRSLPSREAEVIRLFFGLAGRRQHSLEEIGNYFELTRERVRQIKEKAVRRLKVSSKCKVLKTYLG
jgi:RNA polymerase primary sigma factor